MYSFQLFGNVLGFNHILVIFYILFEAYYYSNYNQLVNQWNWCFIIGSRFQ